MNRRLIVTVAAGADGLADGAAADGDPVGGSSVGSSLAPVVAEAAGVDIAFAVACGVAPAWPVLRPVSTAPRAKPLTSATTARMAMTTRRERFSMRAS